MKAAAIFPWTQSWLSTNDSRIISLNLSISQTHKLGKWIKQVLLQADLVFSHQDQGNWQCFKTMDIDVAYK